MQNKLIEQIIWAIFGLIFFFGGGFDLLMFYASGWNKLAEFYKTDQPPLIKLLNKQSGMIGPCTFIGKINIGVLEDGLYLSIDPFLGTSISNSPLLIPWNAIFRVKLKNDNSLGECYQMDIGTPTVTTLILPKKAFQEVEAILATRQ